MCSYSGCVDLFAAFGCFLKNKAETTQGLFRSFFGGRSFTFFGGINKNSIDLGLDMLCPQDRRNILYSKDEIISGYLNLGEADGWPEGADSRVGISFTRCVLLKYCIQNKKRLGRNAVVFEKVINAFKNCKSFNSRLYLRKEEGIHQPKESRICYDSSVSGWQNHAVSRLVGNLGTTYSPLKPFFEILINSARHSKEDSSCKPFFVSIHANEEELENRRGCLVSLEHVPSNIARRSFYASHLEKPEEFLKKKQAQLGSNATRLLNGLTYLQNVTINAQKVGNCWMKQPMRGLLATLYVELITNRDTLTPAEAWNEATKLYKNIQKVVAIPLVKNLISQCSDATPEMKRVAILALDKQMKL